MRRPFILPLVLGCVGLPLANPAASATEPPALSLAGDPAYGEYLATECVTCHRDSGDAHATIPAIAGRDRRELILALYEYKTRARANPTMQMVTAPLGAEEIASLAAYLSQLPKLAR